MDKILRVNMSNRTIREGPVPPGWKQLGGRGLIPRILLDEVPPTCDPLGSLNKLIFAPGTLVGQMVSSCDRISVGAKSPLTGGVKEANAGGSTGLNIVWLGYKAILIEGRADPKTGLQVLVITENGFQLHRAGELDGLGAHDTAACLREQYGGKISASLIGPGGEMRMLGAGIMHLDKDGYPGRISARGGLGAVMGSKGLKAVVFDPGKSSRPRVADSGLHSAAKKRFVQAIQEHPQTGQIFPHYGTAAMVDMCNSFGGIPTRNFSSGRFEEAGKINGDAFHDMMIERGGDSQTKHACMAGCTIQCSNVYADVNGRTIVSPVEYETIGLVGSNLGIDSPDMIAHLNYQMNDLGLDSIEMGAALGVAAEAGLMDWGDGERALDLMDEVRQGTPLGRVIGNGAVTCGRVFGVERVPAVKGQAISAYDPRAIKGTGVTYATSPQGADHTCGLTIRAKVDHTSNQGQVEVSRNAQVSMAGYDSLGVCIMGGSAFAVDSGLVPDLVNGQHGWGVGSDYLSELGRETISLEREFNRRAGFTSADDRLPEWMTLEKLPPVDTTFDVAEADLDVVFDW